MATTYKTYAYVSDNGATYSMKLSVADAALTDLELFGTGAVNPYPTRYWKCRAIHATMSTGGIKKTLPCSDANAAWMAGNGTVTGGVVTGSRGEKRPRYAPGA